MTIKPTGLSCAADEWRARLIMTVAEPKTTRNDWVSLATVAGPSTWACCRPRALVSRSNSTGYGASACDTPDVGGLPTDALCGPFAIMIVQRGNTTKH